jgi:hypothetical protein
VNATIVRQPATFGAGARLSWLRPATKPATSTGVFCVGNGTTVPAAGGPATTSTIQMTMQTPVANGDARGFRTRRRQPV